MSTSGDSVILRGYFDESGHSADPNEAVVCLAGSLAPLDVWRAFEDGWAEVLVRFGIPYFHMREFAHRRGPFNAWSEDRRQELLRQVVESVRPLTLHLGGAVVLQEYARLSDEQRRGLLNPYYPCLQTCLNHALDYAMA